MQIVDTELAKVSSYDNYSTWHELMKQKRDILLEYNAHAAAGIDGEILGAEKEHREDVKRQNEIDAQERELAEQIRSRK